MTILVVDDNEQNLYQLQFLLGGNGYQVVTAVNGAQALTKARQAPPDLIITDILMPVMDGFSLCREWQKDKDLKPIPLIFYTATYTDERDRKLALSLGVRRFIVKPEEPEVLLRTIREVLQESQAPGPARVPEEAEAPQEDEAVFLKQYNETLVRKLEAKMQQLEQANRELKQEIVERKRAEERQAALLAKLQDANGNLQDFAIIISHDLKTPLRGVATLANWLQSDYADKLDKEGREHLAEMIKRTNRINRMIDDLLQYSRVGRGEKKPEAVPLVELVPAVVEDLAPPPQVRVRIAPGLPVVQGEPARLRLLFQNLVGNAIQFADKPLVDIQVCWADIDPLWQFSVIDNGPGIEERHFEQIFKIFQTLAPKDKTDSSGVGLALVKRIVERVGGRVWVESRLGEGSAFHFTWPKQMSHEAGPEAVKQNERLMA